MLSNNPLNLNMEPFSSHLNGNRVISIFFFFLSLLSELMTHKKIQQCPICIMSIEECSDITRRYYLK